MNSNLQIETILENRLREVAAALEAEDPLTAVPAIAGAVRAIEEANKQGIRIDPQKIITLRNLQEQCDYAAKKLSTKLRESVMKAGNSRKATDTYGDK
jgi:S-adenosylmethionine:diacylglycerol 3-amino-3-carboxypropyl transferase